MTTPPNFQQEVCQQPRTFTSSVAVMRVVPLKPGTIRSSPAKHFGDYLVEGRVPAPPKPVKRFGGRLAEGTGLTSSKPVNRPEKGLTAGTGPTLSKPINHPEEPLIEETHTTLSKPTDHAQKRFIKEKAPTLSKSGEPYSLPDPRIDEQIFSMEELTRAGMERFDEFDNYNCILEMDGGEILNAEKLLELESRKDLDRRWTEYVSRRRLGYPRSMIVRSSPSDWDHDDWTKYDYVKEEARVSNLMIKTLAGIPDAAIKLQSEIHAREYARYKLSLFRINCRSHAWKLSKNYTIEADEEPKTFHVQDLIRVDILATLNTFKDLKLVGKSLGYYEQVSPRIHGLLSDRYRAIQEEIRKLQVKSNAPISKNAARNHDFEASEAEKRETRNRLQELGGTLDFLLHHGIDEICFSSDKKRHVDNRGRFLAPRSFPVPKDTDGSDLSSSSKVSDLCLGLEASAVPPATNHVPAWKRLARLSKNDSEQLKSDATPAESFPNVIQKRQKDIIDLPSNSEVTKVQQVIFHSLQVPHALRGTLRYLKHPSINMEIPEISQAIIECVKSMAPIPNSVGDWFLDISDNVVIQRSVDKGTQTFSGHCDSLVKSSDALGGTFYFHGSEPIPERPGPSLRRSRSESSLLRSRLDPRKSRSKSPPKRSEPPLQTEPPLKRVTPAFGMHGRHFCRLVPKRLKILGRALEMSNGEKGRERSHRVCM